jgi:hypothetical protein
MQGLKSAHSRGSDYLFSTIITCIFLAAIYPVLTFRNACPMRIWVNVFSGELGMDVGL